MKFADNEKSTKRENNKTDLLTVRTRHVRRATNVIGEIDISLPSRLRPKRDTNALSALRKYERYKGTPTTRVPVIDFPDINRRLFRATFSALQAMCAPVPPSGGIIAST